MTDPLDDRLAAAGRVLSDDAEVSSALHALGVARAADAHSARRRRILLPAITIGTVLALCGAGAVVATQWQPWAMEEPDLVVAREWTDVAGTYLGSCETHFAANAVSADVLPDARQYLESLDVDSIAPDAEIVASGLRSVGRPDDVGRLISGAVASDFDTHHQGELLPSDVFSDARILQDGLTWVVFEGMYKSFEAKGFDPQTYEGNDSSVSMETQCTTDPSRMADE